MRNMKRVQQGFTLIELMIVIAIIAILVALAVPAYQDYTIRTKVTECINSTAPVKLAVSETYQSDGTMPADLPNAGVANDAGNTQFCTALAGSGGSDTFTINVVADNGAIGGAASGQTLAVNLVGTGDTGTGDVDWDCQNNGTQTRWLPATCRAAAASPSPSPTP